MKQLLFAALFLISLSITAQIQFQNPSFEGPPGRTGQTPPPWNVCNGTTDTEPGVYSLLAPQDGNSFIGIWSGPPLLGGQPGVGEGFSQLLDCPLVGGKEYTFTVWLAVNSDTYDPGDFAVFGGTQQCDVSFRLWSTVDPGVPAITANWQQFEVNFVAPQNLTHIAFYALAATGQHVCLDNIGVITKAPGNVIVQDASCPGGNGSIQYERSPTDGTLDYELRDASGALVETDTSDTDDFIVNNLAAGTYTVTVIDLDEPCPVPVIQEIVVNGPPTIDGTISANPNPVCEGDVSSLTFTPVDNSFAMSYQWEPANLLNNPNAQNPTASITGETTFTLHVEKADDALCFKDLEFTLEYVTNEVGEDGEVTACRDNNSIDLFTELEGTPSPGGSWSSPSGAPSSGIIDPAIAESGIYTYTKNNPGCPPKSVIVDVTIVENLPITAVIDQDPICTGDELSITLSYDDPGGTFSWSGVASSQDVTGMSSGTSNMIQETIQNTGATQQTVSYTINGVGPAPLNCPAEELVVDIAIDPLDDPNFEYPANTLCISATAIDAEELNPQYSGVFSVSPSGLDINPNTGEINPSASSLGNYTITYTTDYCVNSQTFDISIVDNPDATFTIPDSVCTSDGLVIPQFPGQASAGTFTASPNGLNLNPNTGNIMPGASVPKKYTVTNAIGSQGGCQPVSATQTIVIAPAAVVSLADDLTICSNSDANIITNLSGGATSFTLSSNGGVIANPNQSPTSFTPSQAQLDANQAIISVLTNDPMGPCPATADNLTIQINDSAFVDAGPDESVCAEQEFQLKGQVGGGATSIQWSKDNGFGRFSSFSRVDAKYNSVREDGQLGSPITITITTNDPDGAAGPCPVATDQMLLTVLEKDDANFTFDNTLFCVTGSDPSPNTSGDPGAFTAFPSGLSFDPTSGTIDLSASSINKYRIVFTTTGTCTDTADLFIDVVDEPDTEFSYDGPYCETQGPQLPQKSPTISQGTFSASSNNLAVDPFSGRILIDQSQPGTYDVSYTFQATPGCPQEVTTKQVRINDAAEVDAGQDITICSEDTAQLNASFSGSTSTITWASLDPSGFFSDRNDIASTYAPSINDWNGTTIIVITTDDPDGPSEPCLAVTDTVRVINDPRAIVDAGPDLSTCIYTPIQIQNASFSGATSSVTWSHEGFGTFDDPSLINPTYTSVDADTAYIPSFFYLSSNDPAGPCPAEVDSVFIELIVTDRAVYNYLADSFCNNFTDPDPLNLDPRYTGTYFMAPAGGVIDANSGRIDLSETQVGQTYQVTYTTNGPCPNTHTQDVTVVLPPNPRFSIPSEICLNEPGFLPVFEDPLVAGTGIFQSTPFGLAIDTSIGFINPSVSDPNDYNVFYIIDGTISCPEMSHQMPIRIKDLPDVDAGMDLEMCIFDTIQLLGSGEGVLTWSPASDLSNSNSTQPLSIAQETTDYTLVALSNEGCLDTSFMQLTVHPLPPANAGPDFPICIEDTVNLSATGGVSYQWFPDIEIQNSFDPYTAMYATDSREYIVEVIDIHNCVNYDSVFITVNPLPIVVSGPDQIVFAEDGAKLSASGAVNYEWTPNFNMVGAFTSNPFVFVDRDTEFIVTGTDENGCINYDTTNIEIIDLKVPTAFSPNDDGLNERFIPLGDKRVIVLGYKIYNRWGNLIYQEEGNVAGWDGTINGSPAPLAAYMYIVRFRNPENDIEKTQTGSLTLIR